MQGGPVLFYNFLNLLILSILKSKQGGNIAISNAESSVDLDDEILKERKLHIATKVKKASEDLQNYGPILSQSRGALKVVTQEAFPGFKGNILKQLGRELGLVSHELAQAFDENKISIDEVELSADEVCAKVERLISKAIELDRNASFIKQATTQSEEEKAIAAQLKARQSSLEEEANPTEPLASDDEKTDDEAETDIDEESEEATELVNELAENNVDINRVLPRDQASAIRRLLRRHPKPELLKIPLGDSSNGLNNPDEPLIINEQGKIHQALANLRRFVAARWPKRVAPSGANNPEESDEDDYIESTGSVDSIRELFPGFEETEHSFDETVLSYNHFVIINLNDEGQANAVYNVKAYPQKPFIYDVYVIDPTTRRTTNHLNPEITDLHILPQGNSLILVNPIATSSEQEKEARKQKLEPQTATEPEAQALTEEQPPVREPAPEPPQVQEPPADNRPLSVKTEQVERVSRNAAAREKARQVDINIAKTRADRLAGKKFYQWGFWKAVKENYFTKRKQDRADAQQATQANEVTVEIGKLTEQALEGWKQLNDETKKREMTELYEMVAKRYRLDQERKPNKIVDTLVKNVGPAAIGVAFKLGVKALTGFGGLAGAFGIGALYGGITGYMAEKSRLQEQELGYDRWKSELDDMGSDEEKLASMRALAKDKKTFERYFKGRSYEAFKFMNEFYRLSASVESADTSDGSFAEKVLKQVNPEIHQKALRAAGKAALRSGALAGAFYGLTHLAEAAYGHFFPSTDSAHSAQEITGHHGDTPGQTAPTSPDSPAPGQLAPDSPATPDTTSPDQPPVAPPAGAESVAPPETPNHLEWRADNRLEINPKTGHFSEGAGHHAEVLVENQDGATAQDIAKEIAKSINQAGEEVQSDASGANFALTPEQTNQLANELASQIQAEHPGQELFAHGTTVELPADSINDAMDKLDIHPLVHDVEGNYLGSPQLEAAAQKAAEEAAKPQEPPLTNTELALKEAGELAKALAIPAALIGVLAARRAIKEGRLGNYIEQIKNKYGTIERDIKKGQVEKAAKKILTENDEKKALYFVEKLLKSKHKLFIGDEPVEASIAEDKKIKYQFGENELTVTAIEFTKLVANKGIEIQTEEKKKEGDKKPEIAPKIIKAIEAYKEGDILDEAYESRFIEDFAKLSDKQATEALREILAKEETKPYLLTFAVASNRTNKRILERDGEQFTYYNPTNEDIILQNVATASSAKIPYQEFRSQFIDGKIKFAERE